MCVDLGMHMPWVVLAHRPPPRSHPAPAPHPLRAPPHPQPPHRITAPASFLSRIIWLSLASTAGWGSLMSRAM